MVIAHHGYAPEDLDDESAQLLADGAEDMRGQRVNMSEDQAPWQRFQGCGCIRSYVEAGACAARAGAVLEAAGFEPSRRLRWRASRLRRRPPGRRRPGRAAVQPPGLASLRQVMGGRR